MSSLLVRSLILAMPRPAEGIVFLVAVAVNGEAVAPHVGGISAGRALIMLQQVASRVVNQLCVKVAVNATQ